MAVKKQRVTDKVESSEDKLKNPLHSLYFMQARDMVFEGLDWLDFASKLDGLKDEEKLAKLAELAQVAKLPKVTIRTVTRDDEGKVMDVQHTNIPLIEESGGRYRMTVPDLYKRDGSDKYLICDTLFYVDSFSKNDHIAWETFSEEQKLTEKFAKQNDLRLKMRSVVPSDDEIDSLRQEIPGLIEARDQLVKKQNAAFLDLEMDEEAVLKIVARVKLANARLKEAQTQLRVWEDESKPLEIAEKTAPYNAEIRTLEDEVNRIFLTFAHDFAFRQGMTSVTLEEWLERADEQDGSNAIQWCAEGNARRMLGRIAKPLTREEERAREMRALLN